MPPSACPGEWTSMRSRPVTERLYGRGTEYHVKYLALAAAGAAMAGLAACSHTAAPTAAPPSHRAVAPPVSCRQQYATWEHGTGKGLIAALDAVSSAGTASGTHALAAALKNAESAVARGARHPLPACADPRGYWNVLLMHVNAAAASKASPSSQRAAMKDVPKIEQKLIAELNGIVR